MRKVKLALLLVLTAAVLVGGAALPHLMAAVTDSRASGKVSYAPVQTVELELDANGAEEAADMMAKLALYDAMYTIPLDLAAAQMTQEQVIAAAQNELQPYVDAGLMEWCDFDYVMTEFYAAIDPFDPDQTNTFWGVTLSLQEKPYTSVFLHLDDETGKILYLTYTTQGRDFSAEEQAVVLELFPSIYFDALGLGESAEYLRVNGLLSSYNLGGAGISCAYTFGTVEYGEVMMEFCAREYGFDMTFNYLG